MPLAILSMKVREEHDVVAARQRARQIAAAVGFASAEQTRIATAISEIARNAVAYAGGAKVEFAVEGQASPQLLAMRISDEGRGIAALAEILEGRYRSSTGMGLGIIGTRRLMDVFDIDTSDKGTVVRLMQALPISAPLITPERLRTIVDKLAASHPRDAVSEVHQQNLELLRTLEELRSRQEQLSLANHELENTNRGVVALYAELEERTDHLRRIDEVKTRFLSNMTHEFRTPVNSILALSRLLLDRVDGELTPEQNRQVEFIRRAAESLSEMVNDLLDLAKVEAGKTEVRPTEFDAANLFSVLRGMLRPIMASASVELVFDEPIDVPIMFTDESKVSQILRNFLSNAIKFTERGEVRVSARMDQARESVIFAVADTGIGIRPADCERIFQEFSQIDSPLQRCVKGTGLGLPLSKRLAELLGGRVTVESEPGKGSTFSLIVPVTYRAPRRFGAADGEAGGPVHRLPVLVFAEAADDARAYERALREGPVSVTLVRTAPDARNAIARQRPRAVLVDAAPESETAWPFVAELRQSPATREVPVLIVAADSGRVSSFGAEARALKPVEPAAVARTLVRLAFRHTALIIDDDETARYTLAQTLRHIGWEVFEAQSAHEGLAALERLPVEVVFLDVIMPGMNGVEALRLMRERFTSRRIPVFIHSSLMLAPEDRAQIDRLGAKLIPKNTLGPVAMALELASVGPLSRETGEIPVARAGEHFYSGSPQHAGSQNAEKCNQSSSRPL